MAVKNLYPNLPGHLVEFKDGGLQLTSNVETASGKSLLILGTAFDGPVNEPVKIDATTVTQLFGSEVNASGYPNGATLTKYAKQAFKNGFTDVRCMRVTGSQAYVEISKVISETREEVEVVHPIVNVDGNAKFVGQLENVPMVANTLSIVTDGGATVVPSDVNPYTGAFTIGAGSVTKNSTLLVEYQYINIDATAKTQPQENVSNDGATFITIPLTKIDATNNEIIYVTEKDADGNYLDTTGNNPLTDGVKVTLSDGTVLKEDVDYKIVNNELVVIDGGAIQLSDLIDIEYYVCTVETKQHTVPMTGDVDQVIELTKVPVADSIVVKANSIAVDPLLYTVNGVNVSLTAGNFSFNDVIEIVYKHEEVTVTKESMLVRSIYGGSVYKEASVVITKYTNDKGEEGRKFTFRKPNSKMYSDSDLPFYFTSFECPTIGALKAALSNYALNNVFEIVTDNDDVTTHDFPLFSGTLAKGGDDGVAVTNNQMFEALSGKRDARGYLVEQGAYQILENYNVDYIYPAGVYADSKQTVNPNSNFHYELALLCAVLTYRTKMTHGFIDVKPNSNTTLVGIQNHVAQLLEYNNVHYMKDEQGNDIVDAEGNKMDLGWYTSIVAGPDPVVISDTLGTYYGSAAIAYAALTSTLKPESAPTNKALPGVKGMKYKFSNKQMNELVGNRMVVFKLKNEGTATASSTPFVVDGCTAGAPGSDYARIATVKVVTDVVDQIREVADPFLGEPNTVEQRNALAALISKRLSYLKEQGEILHYEFEINATIQQVILGECSIALTLVAPQELRKITTVVALRAAA